MLISNSSFVFVSLNIHCSHLIAVIANTLDISFLNQSYQQLKAIIKKKPFIQAIQARSGFLM